MMGMINSIESRSLFLLKDIVSLALNLPQIYKINHNEEENLKTKTILKKLLILMCNENSVVVKKDGFSGFPNEAGKIILKNENFKNTKDLLKISDKFDNLIRNNRSLEWKFINIELFLRNYN